MMTISGDIITLHYVIHREGQYVWWVNSACDVSKVRLDQLVLLSSSLTVC